MIKILTNSQMPQIISSLFNQWYIKSHEQQQVQTKEQPIICQIFNIRQTSQDIYELQISDSKNLFLTKIYKYALHKFCDQINSNVKKELRSIIGALISIIKIDFIRVTNQFRFEILILEMNYIDGLGGQVINEIYLQTKKPICIKFEDRSIPFYEEYQKVFEKISETENYIIHEKQVKQQQEQQKEEEQKKIQFAELQPKAQYLVYDASQYPEQHYLEKAIKSQFKFVPYVTLKLTSRFIKKNSLT